MRALEFLAGLAAGVALGAAATLLVTPRSGSQMRTSLSREAKRMAVRATGLHPYEWKDISDEENGRSLVENIGSIRSAGL